MQIVANVLNINLEVLVFPNWILTSVLHGFSSDSLLSSVDHDVRIHFAESFGVAREFGLDDVKC